jgi:uncharacterized membrane protein YedE/YeeE
MGGAVIVALIGHRIVLRRDRPNYDRKFDIPANRNLDARLIGGSAVFGIGWGISGFCPSGALPAVGTRDPRVAVFVLALVAGIYAARATMLFVARFAKVPS